MGNTDEKLALLGFFNAFRFVLAIYKLQQSTQNAISFQFKYPIGKPRELSSDVKLSPW